MVNLNDYGRFHVIMISAESPYKLLKGIFYSSDNLDHIINYFNNTNHNDDSLIGQYQIVIWDTKTETPYITVYDEDEKKDFIETLNGRRLQKEEVI